MAAAYDRRLGYQCWTNLDAGFMRPYEPGDRMVRGWADVVEMAAPRDAGRLAAFAEDVRVRQVQRLRRRRWRWPTSREKGDDIERMLAAGPGAARRDPTWACAIRR
jgi:hypothetical protein